MADIVFRVLGLRVSSLGLRSLILGKGRKPLVAQRNPDKTTAIPDGRQKQSPKPLNS